MSMKRYWFELYINQGKITNVIKEKFLDSVFYKTLSFDYFDSKQNMITRVTFECNDPSNCNLFEAAHRFCKNHIKY